VVKEIVPDLEAVASGQHGGRSTILRYAWKPVTPLSVPTSTILRRLAGAVKRSPQWKSDCSRWRAGERAITRLMRLEARGVALLAASSATAYELLGNRLKTAGLGRAMTCAAISLPRAPTFSWPASMAAFTAATSPLINTVM